MKIAQILPILQGELPNAGIPMVMVRLQGCPLKCRYCDTPYALDPKGGTEMSIEEIIIEINKYVQLYNCQWVDISGGEPLLQSNGLKKFVDSLFQIPLMVEIETSGYFPPPEWWSFVSCWVVDWKCPSSGVESKRIRDWVRLARGQSLIDFCFKFVVGSGEDLQFALEHRTGGQDLVSPVVWDIKDRNGEIIIGREQVEWNRRVAQFCLENGFRLSLQTHKYLFGQGRQDV